MASVSVGCRISAAKFAFWLALAAAGVARAEDAAPADSVSRLDLAPPPGLSPDLPPDPPAATIDAPPAARPTPVAAPEAPLSPGEILSGEIHKALDGLVAAKPAGRPIGAGDGFGPRARSALDRIARAREDGLDLRDAPAPSPDLAGADPAKLAGAEIALSTAVVAYAMQASGARVNPRAMGLVTAKPEVADPGFALKRVGGAEDADAALFEFNPRHAGYRELREALARLRGDVDPPVARFSTGPVLTLGMSDPRVPLIRARFQISGADETYDIRVASAVAAFQRVHGIKASGALTEATAAALDGRPATGVASGRERLILANMEMWRWLPRAMGERRVEVNVPDFSLKLMDGENVVHRARVIVGKPDTPTPIFSNAIQYMLFNPIWRVPDSIIKKEMAPKLAADPDYWARRGYKVTYAGNHIEVQQPPGEGNALGRMLFLFPNEHAVYLHDTPSRSLFSASFRALSHGCVRVEAPARLAEILMGGAARGWSEARVNSLVGDKERTVALPAPAPIHIEYFTEFVDDSGRLQSRDDVYGLTARVAAALASAR
jgi:murein L,D-transpeptidase YcbB/YkuD